MNVRCSTKPDKFRNLTLNKEYEATEIGDSYVLTNDAGLSTRYAKKYFTAVRAVRQPPPAPVATPLSEALRVEATFDDDMIEVTMNIGRHPQVSVELSAERAYNSCSIQMLEGISSLKSRVRDLYGRLDHDRYTGSLDDMWRLVFDALIQEAKENCGACVMLTDAVRDGEVEMNAVISEQADAEWSGVNDNSGNTIIVWIIGK